MCLFFVDGDQLVPLTLLANDTVFPLFRKILNNNIQSQGWSSAYTHFVFLLNFPHRRWC